jgi:LacI family transcriptional regulator
MSKPRVAIIATARTNLAYVETIVQGVLQYAGTRNWHIERKRGLPVLFWDDLRQWQGDGLIAQAITPRYISLMQAKAVPAVNIASASERRGIATVCVDNRSIGQLAAEHLLSLGHRQLAFVGIKHRRFSEQRAAAFEAAAAAHVDSTCRLHWLRERRGAKLSPEGATISPETLQDLVATLPRPVGVFAVNDAIAQSLIDACLTKGLRVPDEVSVIGVDNSRLLCETVRPTVSSIDPNQHRVGFAAAELLDQLMAGQSPFDTNRVISPAGVVVRESTQVLAIDDADVVRAIRFIQASSYRPIQVDEVVAATNCSRRPLEIRFKKARGQTILNEIHQSQIGRAKELLTQTDLPVTALYGECGFNSYERFQSVFRKWVGDTASNYRRKHRNPRHA